MQNTKTKVITVLLLSALTLAIFPFAVNASTGFITINTTGASVPGQNVQAGGNVSLYFGNVTFSGGQFTLYIGPQGFSQITSSGPNTDVQYTPIFNLADLQAPALTQIAGTAQYPGGWTIGFNWINGTIKQDVAGGNFFIKAFDGTSTSVAVTDTYITIIANVFVKPTSGNAGQNITVSGYAFPANALVNITYSSVLLGANKVLASLIPTGILGNFSNSYLAPDSMIPLAAGPQTIANETITFNVIQNSTGATYGANYTEFSRGLTQVRTATSSGAHQEAASGTLFGNGTTFTVTGVGVTKKLTIAGNYFYPGSLVTKWDNAALSNTAPTINGTGWFNTTITVPPTTNGLHNITLTDGNNVVFVMFVTVVPSLNLNPTSGPSGTSVTATGYGWGGTTATTSVLATVSWLTPAINFTSVVVDATGSFTTTFIVPNGPGGANTVLGASNETTANVTIATASFTITAAFTVSPASFDNNASLLVLAKGTGFKPGSIYFPNVDNQMLGVGPLAGLNNWQTGVAPDVNGTVSVTFIGAGFNPGTHVFSLYENGTTSPAAYAGFNVTGDPVNPTLALLTNINSTVPTINNINATVNNLHDDNAAQTPLLVAIQGDLAIIKTSVGTTLTTQVSGLGATLSSIQSGIASIQTPNLGPITASLAAISAKLDSVSGDTATITTSLGTITVSLADITTGVTGIHGDTATIKTDLGTLTGKVDSISGNVATITTDLGTIQTTLGTVQSDVTSAKSTTDTLSPLIIVAIVLALIAAIAAIASIVLMRRKIAG